MDKVKTLLIPLPDKWASIVGKLSPTFHDTEEEAGKATDERLKILGDNDARCKVERLACFRLNLPEMLILVNPEDTDNELQLGRTILQELGKFAAKVNTNMRGEPTPLPPKNSKKQSNPRLPKEKPGSVSWGDGK